MSIEDRGGELKDGSLIEEQLEHEADGREIAEAEQARLDPDESVSSHDTHDILDVRLPRIFILLLTFNY